MNRGTTDKMSLSVRRWLGVLVLLLIFSTQVSSRDCPPRSQFNACTCSEQSNGKFVVFCNSITIESGTQSILQVDELVQDLEELRFVGAPDTEIRSDSFLGLANITVLRINYSPITDIPPGTFNSLGRLQVLDLRFNQLLWLSANSFLGLSSTLTELNLDENPLANLRSDLQPLFSSLTRLSLTSITSLVCDCHLRWLRDFLLNDSSVNHVGTTCINGTTVTNSSVNFNQTCLDICQLGYHPCDGNATCSLSANDVTSCQCDPGFTGDGITCVDCRPTCSPCMTIECGQNATCEERGTEPVCTCNTGFTGDSNSCVSLVECEDVCPMEEGGYCIISSGDDIMCASEGVRELYNSFSDVEADPSRLPSFTEQLLNVSSNLTISDDIPQIILFLTESLNLLTKVDDYQEETYNNLVMVGSELLDLDNHHLWFELQNVSRHVANLSLALYGLGRELLVKGNLSDSTQNITISSDNIALVVVRPNCSQDSSNITVSSDVLTRNSSEPQSSLQLPSTIFGEEYDCMEVAVIAVVYDSAGPLLSGEELIPPSNCTPTEAPLAHGQCEWYRSANCTTPQVNSVIISAFAVQHDNTSVNELDTSSLGDPIVITLQHKEIVSMSAPTCVFVDDEEVRSGNGTWMTRQCEVVSHASSANMTVCQCFHLTSFAILTSPTGPPPPNLPLQIVSKIGLSISLLCLLVVIILLFTLK